MSRGLIIASCPSLFMDHRWPPCFNPLDSACQQAQQVPSSARGVLEQESRGGRRHPSGADKDEALWCRVCLEAGQSLCWIGKPISVSGGGGWGESGRESGSGARARAVLRTHYTPNGQVRENRGFEQDSPGSTLIYCDSLVCLPDFSEVHFLICIMQIITHAVGRVSKGDIC